MPSINTVIVNLSPIGSLADLFVLLESFEVSRFSISTVVDRPPDFPLDAEIKSFEARMSTFELGKLRTWGWPEDPKYLNCWSWNSNVLANLQESFAEWLNTTAGPCVVWSFFHRLHLKLSIDATQVATFTNLLPAEIAELQALGLECAVEVKWKPPLTDPTKDAKGRLPTYYFGPQQELKYGAKLIQPSWWNSQHDALIIKQVKVRQWLWRADPQEFMATLSRKDARKYESEFDEQRAETGHWGVWYNGLGAYISRRAYELEAHRLVTSLPVMRQCPACEEDFHESSTRDIYLGLDQLDICKPCLDAAMYRGESDDFTREESLQYLRALADIIGKIPPGDFGSRTRKGCGLIGLTTEQRGRVIILMRDRPSMKLIRSQFSSWFLALTAAGVLQESSRRNLIGTTCVAKDGHTCLSLAEKRIDDLLSQLEIPHLREVPYAGGKFRADFMIGETVIEYFGLMSRAGYKDQAQRKIDFCRAQGIPFLAIYPEDLGDERRLTEKLAAAPDIKTTPVPCARVMN